MFCPDVVGVGSLNAVCATCVVWERRARAPTQDPLEAVEEKERVASIWCLWGNVLQGMLRTEI
jgi:hypothetical protein